MQRQSLGSPLSKLHQAHGGDDTLLLDVDKRSNKDILAFSTSSSSPDFDDDKAIKPHRLSSPPPNSTPDKVIHVIPILTLLCFLILFLFSRTPSPSDLAQFNGFTRLPAANRIDSITDEIAVGGDIRRFIDMRKSDVLAIRSVRELGSETRRLTPRSRSHRKLADF